MTNEEEKKTPAIENAEKAGRDFLEWALHSWPWMEPEEEEELPQRNVRRLYGDKGILG